MGAAGLAVGRGKGAVKRKPLFAVLMGDPSADMQFSQPMHHKQGLDEFQRAAFDAAAQGRNVFLTGPAGCGKSFTLRKIVRHIEDSLRVVRVASSTGVSAILLDLNATTLHMLFGMGDTGKRKPSAYCRKLELPMNKKKLLALKALDTLVIEEISMVPNELLETCDIILRHIRKCGALPFGGVQVITSGDFAQLPQVQNRGSGAPPPVPLFESDTWKACGFEMFPLRGNHRQSGDTVYADLLQRARVGALTDGDVKHLKGRQGKLEGAAGGDVCVLLPSNKKVAECNERFLQSLDQASERLYHCTKTVTVTCAAEEGTPEFDEVMRQAHEFMEKNRAEPTLRLRKGARVMLLFNWNVPEGLANGTLGHVVDFETAHPHEPIVQFANGGPPMTVRAKEYKFDDNGHWSGTYTQIPLTLAWAITIHKCVHGDTLLAVPGLGLARIKDIAAGVKAGQVFERKRGLFFVHGDGAAALATQLYRAPDSDRGNMLRLVTSMGHELVCTREHRIRVKGNDGDEWKEAGFLQVGESVKLFLGSFSYGRGVEASVPDPALARVIGNKFHNKEAAWTVPKAILQGNRRSQEQFLCGVFACKRMRDGGRCVFPNSASARDVQAMLLNAGWLSRRSWSIGKEASVVLLISDVRPKARAVYDTLVSVGKATGPEYDDAPHYDVYVPGSHEFLANGIVTHNSQGATISKVHTNLVASGVPWPGGGYTALSRVRSLQDITFGAFERGSVWADPKVVEYYASQPLLE